MHPPLQILGQRQKPKTTGGTANISGGTDLDKEIAQYIRRHSKLTPEQFERYLRARYRKRDLKERFPDGLAR